MAEKSAVEPPRGRITIFVSDPSAEAEQVAVALRNLGYVVVDVPLAMLVARVAVQRPRIVIVDADADGAYAAVFRMRELPESESIDVLFLGRSSEPSTDSVEDAGSFFARPVDIGLLVRRIETLTSEDVPLQPSAPPTRASMIPPAGVLPSPGMRIERASIPPPSRATRISQPPPSAAAMSRRLAGGPLSNELLELLADAEERAQAQGTHDSAAPSPQDEIEAVLPTELLAALDEPLEEPEIEVDENDRDRHTTSSGGRKVTTGAQSRPDMDSVREVTSNEPRAERTQQPTISPPKSREPGAETGTGTGTGVSGGPAPFGIVRDADSSPPPATSASPSHVFPGTIVGDALAQMLGAMGASDDRADAPSPSSSRLDRSRTSPGGSMSPTGIVSLQPSAASAPPANPSIPVASSLTPHAEIANVVMNESRAPQSSPEPRISMSAGMGTPNAMAGAVSVPPPVGAEAVLGPGAALDTIARAIATRVSGSLSFEAEGGLRRVILREGDLVTCASSLAEESLLAFLHHRGDFPRERAEGLSGRVPAFGRHAGAALVAHGVLRQDQLWPVLRAHAEWILGKTILISQGLFVREAEAPGRLKGEPSVFGGSTGAEVLVDVTRRAITGEDAAARLGGPSATFATGTNEALLVECALDERDAHAVKNAVGRRLEDITSVHGPEAASLLYAVTVLGVLEAVRALPAARGAANVKDDPLDEEAIVAKIEARLALVDEGDYFSVLGVPRSATGYEIRRAFLDLRRTFEPARLLTPRLAHMSTDVTKITSVLEEAFEILRDDMRRERYRRAIEAVPRDD